MSSIRIIVADDHPIFLNGFTSMFEHSREIELVATAPNGEALITKVERLKPDLVFTDITMPIMDGIQATGILTKRFPEIPVIAISGISAPFTIYRILQAGAIGFISKDASMEVVTEAAKAAVKGDTYYSRNNSQMVTTLISPARHDKTMLQQCNFNPTELRIIRMISEGKSSTKMARELKISIHTIKHYRAGILEKTGKNDAMSLIIWAVKNGIVGE